MQPKTSSSAGWLLVILANLLIHLATALPPRASGLRAYRDESDDGGPVRDESVRHLDPIDGVHHFESEQELNDFLRQMEDRMKNTNGKWKVEYRRYSSHSDGAAGGGADGDVQTQLVDGSSSLVNGATMINCKRCTLKVRRVGNGELISAGGGGESSSFMAGSTKASSSSHSSSYGSGASMTADDVLRNYGDVENVAEAGQVNRNVKVTKVVKTSTSGSRGYGSDGSMTVGDLLRDYGNTGERGTGNVKVTKTVTTSTNAETGEDFDADAALARADDILRRYQAGEDLNLPAGSRNVKVTKVVTTSGSGSSGYSGQGGVSQDVVDQISTLGNTGSYGSSNVYGSESYGGAAGGYGNSDSYSSGSRNVKVTKVTTTKTTGGSSAGSFGTGRYSTSASEGDVETLGNTGYSSGMGGSRDMKVTRVTTTSGGGGSSDLYSGSYGSGVSGVTTQEGYGGVSDTASSGGQYNRKVKVTKVVTSSGSTGSYGSHETDDLLNGGSAGNVRVTDSHGGSSGYSSQSHTRNQGSGQVHTSLNYGSSGSTGSLGVGESVGFSGRDVDHMSGQTSGSMRKTIKITKSYWKGDTQLGSFDGSTGGMDEELRRLLEQHRTDGDYQNGKTVTTVTTTTTVNGGTPVVKTERYVKDGYDTSFDMKALDMKSLGTLDTAANSMYGQSHYSTSSLGNIGSTGSLDHLGGTTQTSRKTAKTSKTYTTPTGGNRVITADTGNSHGTVQQTVGQDSSSYILSASGSSEGSYGHGRVPGGEPVHTSSGSIDSSYHTRPDGVPIVTGSYFSSGRKTTDSVSEPSGLPAVSQNGVSQTSGHKIVSSSTYTKHAESTSSGGYGGGSNTHWRSQSSTDHSGDSSSSEEDEAYHGPAPTPSPSIKIGYGTGVGGYGGGSRTVVSGSYSQHTGSSYGGPVAYPAETSGYNTGVKLAPSSGYSSGGTYKSNGHSSGSYGSGSSYGSSGSYGSSHGSSMSSYGSNSDSSYGGSRKVTSYGTGDCVEGSPVCGQSAGDQATGYSRRSPSYSYSQSWSSGSSYGRPSTNGVKGGIRPERISQEGTTDCDDAN